MYWMFILALAAIVSPTVALNAGCCGSNTGFKLTCQEIKSSNGYTLNVPQEIPVHCLKECEHGWYHENHSLLVDSKDSVRRNQLVTEVTSHNLTTKVCLDGLYWKMECHDIKSEECKFVYNDDGTTNTTESSSGIIRYSVIGVGVVVLVAVSIVWYCNRNVIHCFQTCRVTWCGHVYNQGQQESSSDVELS